MIVAVTSLVRSLSVCEEEEEKSGDKKMALAGEENTTENFSTDNKQRAGPGPGRQWPPRPPLTVGGGEGGLSSN